MSNRLSNRPEVAKTSTARHPTRHRRDRTEASKPQCGSDGGYEEPEVGRGHERRLARNHTPEIDGGIAPVRFLPGEILQVDNPQTVTPRSLHRCARDEDYLPQESGKSQYFGRGTRPSATSINRATASSDGIAPGRITANVAMSWVVRFTRPHNRAFHIRAESKRRSRPANSSCGTPFKFLKPRTLTATTFCITAARNFATVTGSPSGSGGNHARFSASRRPKDSRGVHQSRG